MLTTSLLRSKIPYTRNECPGYDTKQSVGEVPVRELWVMVSTPSLPLIPGPLSTGVVVPVRVQSMGQIELFNYFTVQTSDCS